MNLRKVASPIAIRIGLAVLFFALWIFVFLFGLTGYEGLLREALMIKVTSLKSDLYAAQDIAKLADDQWQAELNRLGIERYSRAAKGRPGTKLRALYEAKFGSDDKVRELTDTMRRFQDVKQIQRP